MDTQQKIVTAALLILAVMVAQMVLAGDAFAYGEKHGYQAPVGGSDHWTFSGAHEDDIHGDGNNPDHMDMGGDDMNDYESDWNMEY